MAGGTRPVRMAGQASFASATPFSIFSSASKRTSSITSAPVSRVVSGPWSRARPRPQTGSVVSRADQRADLLTSDGPDDVALTHQIEDDDGKIVVHAETDG